MKAILISVRPKWIKKIFEKEKTAEIRKNFPEIELPITIYLYCCKNDKLDYCVLDDYTSWFIDKHCRGKICAKFTLNKVSRYINGVNKYYLEYGAGSCDDFEAVLKPSCLTEDELTEYSNNLSFQALHIDDLEIFSHPRRLDEFKLKSAPQSWCYIEVKE